MSKNDSYHKGLLYLIHLLISADDVVAGNELYGLHNIQKHEKISDRVMREFQEDVTNISERDLYYKGLDLISGYPKEDQLRAFVWLYKLSAADGDIHSKEIRFMLYSLRQTGIEYEEVVKAAESYPTIEAR